MSVSRAQSESIGVNALIWLAGDDERMSGFLGMTGADPANLRDEIKDPAFLGAVLDYILMSDEMVLAFAGAEGLAPEQIPKCRAMLPGGDHPHWT